MIFEKERQLVGCVWQYSKACTHKLRCCTLQYTKYAQYAAYRQHVEYSTVSLVALFEPNFLLLVVNTLSRPNEKSSQKWGSPDSLSQHIHFLIKFGEFFVLIHTVHEIYQTFFFVRFKRCLKSGLQIVFMNESNS